MKCNFQLFFQILTKLKKRFNLIIGWNFLLNELNKINEKYLHFHCFWYFDQYYIPFQNLSTLLWAIERIAILFWFEWWVITIYCSDSSICLKFMNLKILKNFIAILNLNSNNKLNMSSKSIFTIFEILSFYSLHEVIVLK